MTFPRFCLSARRGAAFRRVLLAAIASVPTLALAQILPPEPEVVHRYARPGQPVINVYVWGAAGLSGVWEVEAATDLVELLSLARPEGIGVIQPGTRQDATVSVYRLAVPTGGAAVASLGPLAPAASREGAGGPRELVYSGPLDSLLVSAGPGFALAEADVVTVEVRQTRPFGWRDITTIVGTAASLAVLILRVF